MIGDDQTSTSQLAEMDIPAAPETAIGTGGIGIGAVVGGIGTVIRTVTMRGSVSGGGAQTGGSPISETEVGIGAGSAAQPIAAGILILTGDETGTADQQFELQLWFSAILLARLTNNCSTDLPA